MPSLVPFAGPPGREHDRVRRKISAGDQRRESLDRVGQHANPDAGPVLSQRGPHLVGRVADVALRGQRADENGSPRLLNFAIRRAPQHLGRRAVGSGLRGWSDVKHAGLLASVSSAVSGTVASIIDLAAKRTRLNLPARRSGSTGRQIRSR